MDYLTLIAYGILNTLFTVLISPLFISLIKIVKAHAQKRRGPPLLQTYRNLAKLLKKETIYSTNSSWIMRATPFVNVVSDFSGKPLCSHASHTPIQRLSW